tara:strand:+ start:16977 stop:17468 length:492 start_codon:yes stop_codon:yes gene_type:complete
MSYLAEISPIQNYVHNVDTSFTKQAVTTTIIYYPGTEVTYTPVTGATKVIYECNFQIAWNPDNTSSYSCSRLQYSTDGGTSWTTISGTQLIEGNESPSADYQWHNIKNTYVLDAWSGERKLRLAGRAHRYTEEFTFGRNYNTIPTSGEGSGCCPHVSIYSVMS